jgi:hypothetical protein
MSRWNVRASTLLILGCVVSVMLLIVVLPDVDLPDTAFHQGTAPLVVHARATMAPLAFAMAALFLLLGADKISRPTHEPLELAVSYEPNFRPILLCSIRR